MADDSIAYCQWQVSDGKGGLRRCGVPVGGTSELTDDGAVVSPNDFCWKHQAESEQETPRWQDVYPEWRERE